MGSIGDAADPVRLRVRAALPAATGRDLVFC
jgi:hypothetical protein